MYICIFFRATKTRDIHAYKLIYRMRSFRFFLRDRASRFERRKPCPRQFQDPENPKRMKIPGNLKIRVWYNTVYVCVQTVLRHFETQRETRARSAYYRLRHRRRCHHRGDDHQCMAQPMV